jgi:hypothetical protein
MRHSQGTMMKARFHSNSAAANVYRASAVLDDHRVTIKILIIPLDRNFLKIIAQYQRGEKCRTYVSKIKPSIA